MLQSLRCDSVILRTLTIGAFKMNRTIVALVAALFIGFSIQAADKKSPSSELSFTKLPLSFEPNMGQGDPATRFLARGAAYSVKLESSRAVLDLDSRTLTMELLDASPRPAIQSEEIGRAHV